MCKDRGEARARAEAKFPKQQRAGPEAAEAKAEREAQARVVAVNTSHVLKHPMCSSTVFALLQRMDGV